MLRQWFFMRRMGRGIASNKTLQDSWVKFITEEVAVEALLRLDYYHTSSAEDIEFYTLSMDGKKNSRRDLVLGALEISHLNTEKIQEILDSLSWDGQIVAETSMHKRESIEFILEREKENLNFEKLFVSTDKISQKIFFLSIALRRHLDAQIEVE